MCIWLRSRKTPGQGGLLFLDRTTGMALKLYFRSNMCGSERAGDVAQWNTPCLDPGFDLASTEEGDISSFSSSPPKPGVDLTSLKMRGVCLAVFGKLGLNSWTQTIFLPQPGCSNRHIPLLKTSPFWMFFPFPCKMM